MDKSKILDGYLNELSRDDKLSSQELRECFETLMKFLRNVRDEKCDATCKTIKVTNKRFNDTLWRYDAAKMFLLSSGWVYEPDQATVRFVSRDDLTIALDVLQNNWTEWPEEFEWLDRNKFEKIRVAGDEESDDRKYDKQEAKEQSQAKMKETQQTRKIGENIKKEINTNSKETIVTTSIQQRSHSFKSVKELMKSGSDKFHSKAYLLAVKNFDEALTALNENPSLKDVLKITPIEEIVLKYALGMSCFRTGLREELYRAIHIFEDITTNGEIRFPSAYLGLGYVYYKLNRFEKAMEYISKGMSILSKNLGLTTFCSWPMSDQLIDETISDILKEEFKELEKSCKCPPRPDAVCILEPNKCLNDTRLIYYTDPDFKGFVSVHCIDKCRVNYHVNCWRQYKEEANIKNDKDFLRKVCLTDGCNSPIYWIQIINKDGLIEWEDKLKEEEFQPKISKIKNEKIKEQTKPQNIKNVNPKRSKFSSESESNSFDCSELVQKLSKVKGEKNMEQTQNLKNFKSQPSSRLMSESEADSNAGASYNKHEDAAFKVTQSRIYNINDENFTKYKKQKENQDPSKVGKIKSHKREKMVSRGNEKQLDYDQFIREAYTREEDLPLLFPPIATGGLDNAKEDWVRICYDYEERFGPSARLFGVNTPLLNPDEPCVVPEYIKECPELYIELLKMLDEYALKKNEITSYVEPRSQHSTRQSMTEILSEYDEFPPLVQSGVTKNIIDIVSGTIKSHGCIDEDDLIIREIIAGNNLDSDTQQQICDAGGLFPYLMTQTGIFILHEGRLYLKDCDIEQQLYENIQEQESILPNENIQPFNNVPIASAGASLFWRSSEGDEEHQRNDSSESDAEIEKYKNEILLDKQQIESLQAEIGLLRDSSKKATNKHKVEMTSMEQQMDDMKKELEIHSQISAKASSVQQKLKNEISEKDRLITNLEHKLMISSVEVDQLKKSNAELSQTHLESLKEIEENQKAHELRLNELGRLKMFCFDIKQYEFELILNKYKDIIEALGDCLKVEHSRFAGNVEICQNLNEFVDRVRTATEWFIQEKTRVDTVMSEIKDKFSDAEYELNEEDFPDFELKNLPHLYHFYQDILDKIPMMYLNDLSILQKMSDAKTTESRRLDLNAILNAPRHDTIQGAMEPITVPKSVPAPALSRVNSVSSVFVNTIGTCHSETGNIATNSASPKTSSGSLNKLVKKLVDHFPNTTEEQLRQYVLQYRESRGSLNGLKMGVLIEEIKSFVRSIKTAKTEQPQLRTWSLQQKSNLSCNAQLDIKVCSICLEDLHSSDSETADCGHIFHTTCIKDWMTSRSSNRETNNSCPNCRAFILSTSDYPTL